MRWTVALVPVVLSLASCGSGIYVPDADAYVTNPFRDFSVRRTFSINQDWDTALAPISCKQITNKNKVWFISGSVVANGILFRDGPILDPAFVPAYVRKSSKHIGPDC